MQSKADFVDRVNAGLKESAINTSVTGNVSSGSAELRKAPNTVFDLTSRDRAQFKFDLTVNGKKKEIDFYNQSFLVASDDTNARLRELAIAMSNQIQIDFDDSLTVTQSEAVFTITDAQGRSLSIEQGKGTGFFFGTDSQNSGALVTAANVQNNLSVAFDGDDLVINHAAAGGVDLTNYTAADAATYTQFTPTGNATSSLAEPVIPTEDELLPSASFRGKVSESKIAMNFSNVFGYAHQDAPGRDIDLTATYAFVLTDGAGTTYASFTGNDILDVQRLNNSDAEIISAVEAQIMATAFPTNTDME